MSSCCVCMELCTDKAVVRTPSAPTPSTEIPQILRTVGPPEGAPPRRLRPSFAPDLPLHLSHARHAAQALINCGHIYHLSCARRWFQTKGKSERGRPAHAPCPKCKEPYDMGSAVTVFMDVPKDERGEILFSPTPFPTRAGRGDVPDDADGAVVDDDDADAVVLDSPRDGADRPGDTAGGDAATRREVASLRRDLRREQTRAREADDRAARAEMAAERADRLEEERDALQTELARREQRENNALYEARTAKAKAKKASDELSSRLAEFQRAQSKLAYVENQRRLERDLNEGVSMAETELLNRFRREEPRSAVETLCRSLAGKNRQLARQIDEYGKLVRRVKQLERGGGGVGGGGGGAPVAGSTGAGSIPTGSAPPSPGFGKEKTGEPGKERGGGGAAGGGRLDRSKRRAWGADDEDAWDDVAAADADDALRLRRPLRDANAGFEKGLGSVDFSKGSFGRVAMAKGLGAFDDHGLGRVSRAAAAGGKGKRARGGGGASGEELLDDILSGLDLPKTRAEEKVRKPTSSSGGGDFGSFSRRFGSAAAAATAEGSGGGDGGSFVIHGADGRGGRTKVIRAAGSAR